MINYGFIQTLEGNSNIGYVPDPEHSKSGVTIASGFDLGARRLSDLIGLPKTIIDKLAPYLSLKGTRPNPSCYPARYTYQMKSV